MNYTSELYHVKKDYSLFTKSSTKNLYIDSRDAKINEFLVRI